MAIDIIQFLASIGSGLAAGLLVAIINHYFTRRKTNAETEKLEAEAVKIRLETQKLLTEMETLSSTVKEVSYKLGAPAENVIYDGRVYCDGSHFKAQGDRFWREPHEKPKGMGSFKVESGILSVDRTNTGGRFRITLLNYLYDGVIRDYLPKNVLLAGKRQLKLSCEAKATGGSHTLLFVLKKTLDGGHLDKHEETFTRNEWIRLNVYFRIPPNEDCQLWFDDQNVSQANSSVQLRNFVLTELTS